MSTVKLYCGALPNMPWQESLPPAAPCLALYRKPVIGRNPLPGVARISTLPWCPIRRVHRCFPRRAGQRHPVYLSGTQRRRHPLGF